MVEQSRLSEVQKGKAIAIQRTHVAEQRLRMVPMIAGPTLISEEKKKKSRQKKRTEERIK